MDRDIDAKTIGSRAKLVRDELGLQQQAIADKMGISLRAWQKMERDEGTPSGETLLTFEALGVNPGWVLTGIGPRRAATWQSEDAEAEIFMRVCDVVSQLHQEAHISIPGRGLAKAARAVFAEVTKSLEAEAGPAEIEAAIAFQAAKMRRQLLEAKEKPGTGKRSA